MDLIHEDAVKLEQLPDESFFLDSITLQGGVKSTDDVYKNSLRALAILGCSCVGHTGTRENGMEEGFYVTASTEQAVRRFLDLQGEVQAPKYVPADSDLNFVKATIEKIKSTYAYDFSRYFYFVLIVTSEDDGLDIKTKQLPKHPNVILGKNTESLTQSMKILMPYLQKMQPDDHDIVSALAASAFYARSKCPFESG